jgi:hypothetical protein
MSTTEVTPPPTQNQMCPLCGTPLDPVHPTECTKCDWVLGYRRRHQHFQHPSTGRDRAAMLMSVVPGLGHIYKGHNLVGAILMVGTVLVSFFVAATVSATAGVALVLVPIYWSIVMVHALWADDLSAHQQTAAPLPH